MFESVFCASIFFAVLAFLVNYRDQKLGEGLVNKDESGDKNSVQIRRDLQKRYLMVYIFMVAGDWLQGPYVYALYEAYGFDKDTIALLFVTGFASSMFIGTFVGSLADSIGRKKSALLFVFLYVASCWTKHSKLFFPLLVGRVLGGAATSLLMSVFESWLVCEYNLLQEKFPRKNDESAASGLSETFSYSTLLNYLVAIFSGLVGEFAVNKIPFTKSPSLSDDSIFFGGLTMPFDIAAGCLIIGGIICHFTWTENYGNVLKKNNQNSLSQLMVGLKTITSNKQVFYAGVAQASFESSMYCFVFMWTPALSKSYEIVPFGLVFTTFMLCSMAGSQLYSFACRSGYSNVSILTFTGIMSSISLAMGPLSEVLQLQSPMLQYIGFLGFEVCVGLFFPSMGCVKGSVVPEQNRATVYSLYRVPMNFVVLFVLLNNFSETMTFSACAALLFVGSIASSLLKT